MYVKRKFEKLGIPDNEFDDSVQLTFFGILQSISILFFILSALK